MRKRIRSYIGDRFMPIGEVEKVIDYKQDRFLFSINKKSEKGRAIKEDLEKEVLSNLLRKEFKSYGYFLSENAKIISGDRSSPMR